jgi:predicted lipase
VDVKLAIEFAQLVNAAYGLDPQNTTSLAGQPVKAGALGYTIVTTVFANDLATEIMPGRSAINVPIGLVLQKTGGDDIVIAIRGTAGVYEWIQDARFSLVPCPFLAAAGNTEDGFTAMYASMRTGSAPGAPTLVSALPGLAFPKPVSAATSVTICGHSLGGALVTLLALDVAANTIFTNPTVYSYASPRAGDSTFAAMYDHLVPNTYRIANRVDIVPKLPMPPLYGHVKGLYELNPIQLLPLPPKVLVRPELACEHILSSYLFMLSLKSGGPVIPLEARCSQS